MKLIHQQKLDCKKDEQCKCLCARRLYVCTYECTYFGCVHNLGVLVRTQRSCMCSRVSYVCATDTILWACATVRKSVLHEYGP